MSGVRASPSSGAFLYFTPLRRLSCIPSPNPSPPNHRARGDDHFTVVPCLARADTLASPSSLLPNSHSRSFAAPAGLRRRQPRGLYIRSARPTSAAPPRNAFFIMFMSCPQLSPYIRPAPASPSPRRVRVRLISAYAATPLYRPPSPIPSCPSRR
ncbi:hypothetical protein B0H12DRAFT_29976 [Mycena haematopus]|nr:hypothetical protein B0H12DRAFT_29976 [Mycena haematopus]